MATGRNDGCTGTERSTTGSRFSPGFPRTVRTIRSKRGHAEGMEGEKGLGHQNVQPTRLSARTRRPTATTPATTASSVGRLKQTSQISSGSSCAPWSQRTDTTSGSWSRKGQSVQQTRSPSEYECTQRPHTGTDAACNKRCCQSHSSSQGSQHVVQFQSRPRQIGSKRQK